MPEPRRPRSPARRTPSSRLRKGSKVYVEGKLQTRKWQDQSGQDRYTTEIVLNGPGAVLTMLDGASQGGQTERRGVAGADNRTAMQAGAEMRQAAELLDDEVPF